MKAIEYRKKHPGVTLKQAFAWAKKGTPAVGKKVATKKRKYTAKKMSARSAHKDTKSHNVNIRVVSGTPASVSGFTTASKKLLSLQYGHLAAKKIMEKTKREKKNIQKKMTDIAIKLRKLKNL